MALLSMRARPAVLFVIVLMLAGALGACRSGASVAPDALEGRTLAVTAAVPEPPIVYHTGLAALNVRPYAPYGDRPQGVAVQEARQAQRVETVLQAAADETQPVRALAAQLGKATAEAWGMELVADPGAADVVLDVKVLGYGLTMPSWRAGVAFFLDADAALIDQANDRTLWTYTYDRERTSRPDIPYPAIGRMTVEELGGRLLDYTDEVAIRIGRRLQRDAS